MHFNKAVFSRIETKLTKLSLLGFITYVFILSLVVSFIFSAISVILLYTVTESNLMSRETEPSFIDLFITAVILSPVFETLLFQHIPYYFFKKGIIFNSKPTGLLLFSAIIFGAIHFYSPLYMLATFFSGLIYMLGYMSRANISIRQAYWIVVAVHALNNLFAILLHRLVDLIP